MYNQEFEEWWGNYTKTLNNYSDYIYPINIEEAIKKFAYSAWQHQQETIDELTKENDSLIDTADKLYYGLM